MSTCERRLLIFVKEPRSDVVKTRLAPLFDREQRRAFYVAMVRDLAEATASVACDRRSVCWAPDAEPRTLAGLFDGAELVPQKGPDLGARMEHALMSALGDAEDTAAVLIGSDAPLLGTEEIDRAFDVLETRDLVLAPSYDGGYSLIGARSRVVDVLPNLFRGMAWSVADVFSETLDRIEALRDRNGTPSLGLLPMVYDIDRPEDVARLEAHLRARELAGVPVPTHTFRFLRTLRRRDLKPSCRR